jgi:hypothetical protein
MEITVIIFIAVFLYFLFSKSGKSKRRESNIFRDICSATEREQFDLQQKTIESLLQKHYINLPKQRRYTNLDTLKSKIEELLFTAAKFDESNTSNYGAKAAEILAIDLQGKLNAAGINDYDQLFEAVKNIGRENTQTSTVVKRSDSKGTKLFNRSWKLTNSWSFDASGDEILRRSAESNKIDDEIIALYEIKIPESTEAFDAAIQGDKIGKLMADVAEFDIEKNSNPKTAGIYLASSLAKKLKEKLNVVGVNEFDLQLEAMQQVDIAKMARAVSSAMKKNEL